MSQENVETVQRGFRALQSGEFEAFVACFDPDVEVRPLMAELEGRFSGTRVCASGGRT